MTVTFESGNPDCRNSLFVEIETEKLTIRSVGSSTDEKIQQYVTHFMDKEVSKNLCYWKEGSTEGALEIVDEWKTRWDKGLGYSAFEAYDKQSEEWVGHVCLDSGMGEGHTLMSYAVFEGFRGKGVGQEMVSAIVQDYLPVLQGKKIFVPHGFMDAFHFYPLSGVEAIVDPNNLASKKLLSNLRFVYTQDAIYIKKLPVMNET